MARLSLRNWDTAEKVAAFAFVVLVSLPIIIIPVYRFIIRPVHRQWSRHHITITVEDYTRHMTPDEMFSVEIPSGLEVTRTQTSRTFPPTFLTSGSSATLAELHTQEFILRGDENVLGLGLFVCDLPSGVLHNARKNRGDIELKDLLADGMLKADGIQSRIRARETCTRPSGTVRRVIGTRRTSKQTLEHAFVLEVYSCENRIVLLVAVGAPELPDGNSVVEHFFDSFRINDRPTISRKSARQ